MSLNDITQMNAMVLAAGLGTRMRPLTDLVPKPMLKVGGKTLIDHTLDWLYVSGVKNVVVNSFYKAELLEAHIAAREHPAIRISHEDVLLETGGGIRHALPLLGTKPFFAINSDTICIDGAIPALQRLWQAWDDRQMDALLLLHPVTQAVGYEGKGDFFMTDDGTLRRRQAESSAPFVFTGVQLLHPRLFEASPEGAFSLNYLYNRNMSSDGTLQRIAGLHHDGHWLHVGDIKGLQEAQQWFSRQQ